MTNKPSIVASVIVMMLIVLGLYAKGAKANDWEQMYLEEEETYVVAYGKPFPQGSPFKCKEGSLWKGWNVVKDYKGKAVQCTLETMTRGEYEIRNDISRTF